MTGSRYSTISSSPTRSCLSAATAVYPSPSPPTTTLSFSPSVSFNPRSESATSASTNMLDMRNSSPSFTSNISRSPSAGMRRRRSVISPISEGWLSICAKRRPTLTTPPCSLRPSGTQPKYPAFSLHRVCSSAQCSAAVFQPHPDGYQSQIPGWLPVTGEAWGTGNGWCSSRRHPARCRQTDNRGGNWRSGRCLPYPDRSATRRQHPETRCSPQSSAVREGESGAWFRFPAHRPNAEVLFTKPGEVNPRYQPRIPQTEPGPGPVRAWQTDIGCNQQQRLRPTSGSLEL